MGQRLFVVLSVVGMGMLYVYVGWTMRLAPSCVLLVACVYLSLQDAYHGILPDRVVFPLAIAGLLYAMLDSGTDWTHALLGGIAGGTALLILRIVSRGGVGLGDVKFASALGCWLGVYPVALAIWLSYMLGGLWALYRLAQGASRKDVIPFGPFLSASSMLVFALQDAAWQWLRWWV